MEKFQCLSQSLNSKGREGTFFPAQREENTILQCHGGYSNHLRDNHIINDMIMGIPNYRDTCQFPFSPKFCLLISEEALEAKISHLVGRRPTVESGTPLEVDQFFRKMFIWTEAFHITAKIYGILA